jgi:divalent metal cation (Fe/Co/Zn/Cd) transporter
MLTVPACPLRTLRAWRETSFWVADPHKAPTIWQTAASVLASFFGVQSSKNRERDFRHGKPAHFIAMGLGVTVLFVLLVILVVRITLRQAGL